MTTMTLTPGTLIVLEGLDKTGKSTQAEALGRILEPSTTHHLHTPSGATPFTKNVYGLLESAEGAPTSGVARQLAHLSCHAETVPQLQHLLLTGGVVLDRWWWSTFAYGWFTGDLPAAGITEAAFRNLVESIWGAVTASVVFLFDKPYETDANNADPVADGYHHLAAGTPNTVVLPQGDAAEITELIVAELNRRSLTVR